MLQYHVGLSLSTFVNSTYSLGRYAYELIRVVGTFRDRSMAQGLI